MKLLGGLATLLVLVGAINWGLWGLFQFDLVAWTFHGNTNLWARLCYTIVGCAGVWLLICKGKWKCLAGCCSCSPQGGSGPHGCCR